MINARWIQNYSVVSVSQRRHHNGNGCYHTDVNITLTLIGLICHQSHYTKLF